MKTIKYLSEKLLAAAAVLGCLAGAVACSDKGTDDKGDPNLGPLSVIFSADDYAVEPGGTISMPFTVMGVEGATLTATAAVDNSGSTVSAAVNEDGTGSVNFTAPSVTDDVTATVILTVSDQYKRSATARARVAVAASESLEIALASNIRSVALKGGGSFTLPIVISGIGAATIADPVITVSSGYNASWVWTSKENGTGTVNVTAPASLGSSVDVKVTVSDNYNRSAEVAVTLSIMAITTSENAANCYIAAPGSTLTINAVKGNSAEKLDFDGAYLVWQDELGMVKSVGGNGAEGVVVVELNAGKSGNALVAAVKGDKIVWSWHVWVSNYDPDEDPFVWTSSKTSTTYTWMDRNLGARGNTKYSVDALGLFYQWGRKDPFSGPDGTDSSVARRLYDIDGNVTRTTVETRPVYGSNDFTSTNLELAIQNPTIFYGAPSSAWPVVDWLTDKAELQDHDLWGIRSGYKSIYDPCPYGWKMPAAGDPWGFRSEYKKGGNLNTAGGDNNYDPEYPWYIEYDDEYCIGFRYKTKEGKEYWFPFTGKLDVNDGVLSGVSGGGNYNTASVSNTTAMMEMFAWGNPASETGLNRTYGSAVRCIKE